MDLISRQAAIDALRNRWLKTRNYEGIGEDIAEECEIYLKTLPSAQPLVIHCTDCEDWLERQSILGVTISELPSAQPEQRWIPCSERYPDMDERVLVYTGAHEYHVWDCMSNRADNYFWEDEEGLYRNKYEASLWMPLPEPYRGEEK